MNETKDAWLSTLDLQSVQALLRQHDVEDVFYKILPKNANSKNQVYLASDLTELSRIPSGEITTHRSTSMKSGRQDAVFRASLELYWLQANGQAVLAPEAKLIFYPQYPEVRFSGFLKACHAAPSSLWAIDKRGQEVNRLLLLGVRKDKKIFALTLPPESPATQAILSITAAKDPHTLLHSLPIHGQQDVDSLTTLMQALCAIHQKGWVPSQRLDKNGQLVPCVASNCNGYTLEALLNIRSNGYALPDFQGWELKARNVPNIARPKSTTVTLFTPEPNAGIYVSAGLPEFLQQFGYPDKNEANRINFGGIYKAGGTPHPTTGLRLVVSGFDPESKIFSATGAIHLLDKNDREAMTWSFAKLIEHWKIKHGQAAFVPSQPRKTPSLEYRFGDQILIGQGTEFQLFLKAVSTGVVYYDPGIHLTNASSATPKGKRRSQFRIQSKNLPHLYLTSRTVNCCPQPD